MKTYSFKSFGCECGEDSKTTYFKPVIFAVALDTRKTKAGLNLFPPAPNIYSAADTKTGFSEPIIYHNILSDKRCQYMHMAISGLKPMLNKTPPSYWI